MPDKNELERRKQVSREIKLKARHEFEKSLPISRENFKGLFNYLDEQLATGNCDDTLKFSVRYLESIKIKDLEKVIGWLGNNGGSCDCEVLANVEEKFDDNAIL